jgi:hypothetical protein
MGVAMIASFTYFTASDALEKRAAKRNKVLIIW